MAQPDDFGFGEEAALLKASARKLFSEKFSPGDLHQLVAGDPNPERAATLQWNESLWQELVALGWPLLAVPEAQGGVDMPLVAVAGLCEEIGRAAFPCPLLTTLACSYVLRACGARGEPALAEIAEGATATLVLSDASGSWDSTDTPVECRDNALYGTAHFVQEPGKCSHLLVCAQSGAGVSLYWLPADAPGVTIAADATVDQTRDQGRVQLDGAQGIEISGNAAAAVYAAMPAIWVLYAADMLGTAEWQLQTTVEYVNARKQFDHPLGFFQAVKHPLVNVMIDIDQARSLLYAAACAVDCEPERAHQLAHMAQAAASDAAAFASSRSVQCHGGIGFTWECYIHLFFKRQKHAEMLWGNGSWHRARLADIVLGAGD